MELTYTQKMLLLIFNVTKIRKTGRSSIIDIIYRRGREFIIKQANKIAQEEDRILTGQELMNILFPILKAKQVEENTPFA